MKCEEHIFIGPVLKPLFINLGPLHGEEWIIPGEEPVFVCCICGWRTPGCRGRFDLPEKPKA